MHRKPCQTLRFKLAWSRLTFQIHNPDMASQQLHTRFCKRKEFDGITNTYYKSKHSNTDNLLPTLDDGKMTVTEHQDYNENEQNN